VGAGIFVAPCIEQYKVAELSPNVNGCGEDFTEKCRRSQNNRV